MKGNIAVLLLAGCASAFAADEHHVLPHAVPRYAFVMSISDYAHHPNVTNAWSDGLAMAKRLYELDFNLVRHVVEPRTKDDLLYELQRFRIDSQVNERQAIVVVYIAAHGFQLRNESLVAAADAPAKMPEKESLSVQWIADAMKPKPGGITIVLIDACRTPGEIGERTVGMDIKTGLNGVMIVYSTRPGQAAKSASTTVASLSPFSFALDTHLKHADWSIERVMVEVGRQVRHDVGQDPAMDKLTGLGSLEFFLKPSGQTVVRHGDKLRDAYRSVPTTECMEDFNERFPANDWTNWAATASRIFRNGARCDDIFMQ